MKTFQELGICPQILSAIEDMGFENPMPVQEEVIPYLLNEDTDVVALAQTGTGKTAAFGLPIIQKVDLKLVRPQALILCPTRELCLQIAGDLADFSKYIDDLKVLPVYGGSSIDSQIRALKKGVHIVVATPGRLLDLMNRGTVQLDNVKFVTLDEADEMLNMGFTDSINAILADVPETRQTLLFSATMPAEIAKIVGVPSGIIGRIQQQARQFPQKTLDTALFRLGVVDDMTKRSAPDTAVFMEMLVYELTR